MLTALCSLLRTEDSIILRCLHVEHGLRSKEESCGDAEFVRDFCREHKIKCRIKHIPQGKAAAFAQRKGIGIEAAARYFRHKALNAEAARLGVNTRILIAHTKDDALELALMRILRGSGPAGLAALAEEKEKKKEKRKEKREKSNREPSNLRFAVRRFGKEILRPLISFSRKEVIAYLNEKGVFWREDATNTDEKFLRNKVRRRLVPLLDEFFLSWRKGVTAMAETQALAADFLTEEARNRIKWDIKNGLFTEAENFFAQPLIIREEALFQAIDEILIGRLNLRTVKRAVVRRFCERHVKAVDLGTVKVRIEEGLVVVSLAEKEFFEKGVSRLI
jgi:tRNA(Ile)-lysidine synthase